MKSLRGVVRETHFLLDNERGPKTRDQSRAQRTQEAAMLFKSLLYLVSRTATMDSLLQSHRYHHNHKAHGQTRAVTTTSCPATFETQPTPASQTTEPAQ